MPEVRGAVTHRQLFGHAQTLQRFTLEGIRIQTFGIGGVQIHVHQCGGEIFGSREALVEGRGGADAGHQIIRHRLARLGVTQIVLDDRLGQHPTLQQLGLELGIVAHAAVQGRVGDIRGQGVQRVTHFVEEGRRVIKADQHRLAGRALDEVGVVGRQHGLFTVKGGVAAIAGRPGARALALAGVGIEIPQADMVAGIAIGHFPDADIGVEDRHGAVGDLFKLEAEELAGHIEHRFAQVLDVEVLLHFLGVQVVFGLTHLFHVVAVIPRLDRDVVATLVCERLHLCDFLFDAGDGGRPDRLHQLQRALGRAGHAVLEAPLGVIVVAQQFNALVTQLQDFGDDGVVVVLVAIVAAIVIGAPDFLAQITLVGIGQERVHGGAGVEHRIFALMAALGGEVGGGGDEAVRQARQLVLAQIGDVVLFVGQHIVGELRVQLGQTRLDLGVALGFRALKGRAVAGEAVIGQLNKTLLVRAQRRHFLTVMDGLDAGEQVLVLGDFG